MRSSPPWDVRLVELPLRNPHRPAHGAITTRQVVVISRDCEAGVAWGECAALNRPTYTAEFARGAFEILRNELLPLIDDIPFDLSTENMLDRISQIRGHRMAKAAIEMAWIDADLKRRGLPASTLLGATRTTVRSTAVLSLDSSAEQRCIDRVDRGWRSIKLKISPASINDAVALLDRLRRRYGTAVDLAVDANGSFGVDDIKPLIALDEFDLAYIEQPFEPGNLMGHAALRKETQTPVCLDESILDADSVVTAAALDAVDVVNIKPARVGGLIAARRVAETCAQIGVNAFCGGMVESGIGRSASLVFAARPELNLPSDLGPNGEYFDHDIASPVEWHDGGLVVPHGVGFGTEVDGHRLDRFTSSRCRA